MIEIDDEFSNEDTRALGLQLGFRDVLIRPEISPFRSRAEVNLEVTYNFKYATNVEWTGIPIVAANMDTVGTLHFACALAQHKIMTAVSKHENSKWREFYLPDAQHLEAMAYNSFYTIGLGTPERDELAEFMRLHKDSGKKINKLLIDCANGYMTHLHDFIRYARDIVKEDVVILAGNVVDGRGARAIIDAGADIVKVGIGSGSVCTTRRVTGVGRPQISALDDVYANIPDGGLIMSDGGCVYSGDIAKCFVGHANFVMLGGMFAGHKEIGLDPLECGYTGELSYVYRGMSSRQAQEELHGVLAAHRAAEGKTVVIEAKPPLEDTLQQILGGLRSTGTYIGKHLQDFSDATLFYVNEQTNDVYGVG